jgi:hypothetical protein
MQQRDLGGIDGEHRLDGEPHQLAPRTRVHVTGDPGLERLCVPAGGIRVARRRLEVNDTSESLKTGLRQPVVGKAREVSARNVGAVPGDAPTPRVEVIADDVGGKGLHAHLGRQGPDSVVSRPHPLAAKLDHLAAADRCVKRPSTDAVARLEYRNRRADLHQAPRAGKPRESSTDDRDVDVDRVGCSLAVDHLDVLPPLKWRDSTCRAGCLIAHASIAVGRLVVEFVPTGSVAACTRH